MQTINLRNMLRLFGQKTILILIILLAQSEKQAFGQHRTKTRYQSEYDNKKVHFGYLLGLGTTNYTVKTNSTFATATDSSVYAITTPTSNTLRMGGLMNVQLNDYFDFRFSPTVSIYSRELLTSALRKNLGDTSIVEKEYKQVDKAWMEFPVAIKYKSERRGNVRMYVMGGFRYGLETNAINFVSRNRTRNSIDTKTGNLNVEYGIGMEWFMRYFKFTPELQFSHGIRNMLRAGGTKEPSTQLQRIGTHNVTLFLMFE